MAQKLFVGGLSFNTTNDGLREFFAQSGTVVSANVVTCSQSVWALNRSKNRASQPSSNTRCFMPGQWPKNGH